MNAGGVSKACKSNGYVLVAILMHASGKRVRNTLVTYPEDRNNSPKGELIPDVIPLLCSGMKVARHLGRGLWLISLLVR